MLHLNLTNEQKVIYEKWNITKSTLDILELSSIIKNKNIDFLLPDIAKVLECDKELFYTALKVRGLLYIHSSRYKDDINCMKLFWDGLSPDMYPVMRQYLPQEFTEGINTYLIENKINKEWLQSNLKCKKVILSTKL